MLFDPAEEQLDLPATPIESGDSQSRQLEVVGEKDQSPLAFGIVEGDAAERVRIGARRPIASQGNRVIAAQARGTIHFSSLAARAVEIPFAADHEERAALSESIEALVIDVGAIHNIEGSWLDGHQVENCH